MQYEADFPPLSSTLKTNIGSSKNECMLTLEDLKLIPVKERTANEMKRYKHLMYIKSKEKYAIPSNTTVLDGPSNNIIIGDKECLLSLDELKKIPVKKRSKEETKRYKHLMYHKGKETQKRKEDVFRTDSLNLKSDEGKHKPKSSVCHANTLERGITEQEELRITWRIKKAEDRKRKRNDNEKAYKESMADEKAFHREKAARKDIVYYRKCIAKEKANSREKAVQKDEDAFRKLRALEKSQERKKGKERNINLYIQKIAKEKSCQRAKAKEKDIIAYKKSICEEKSSQRVKARQKDRIAYKESIAMEKSSQRAKAKGQNQIAYKKSVAKEKSCQRGKAMGKDPVAYRKAVADEKANQRKRAKEENKTLGGRNKIFRESVRHGRIFSCVCCERLCFNIGVKQYTEEFRNIVDSKFDNITRRAIGNSPHISDDSISYICLTCKRYIEKGKVPPMSKENSLSLIDLSEYDELHVTELENSMIALNLIFQKVFKLPKTRWPGMKDKIINIPLFESDILNTVESLPRTPTNAGIIPINFKRKLGYKNNHMVQFVSVPKIMKALRTLKRMGNIYYQFVHFSSDFEDECRENDLEGFHFIFPEDEISNHDKILIDSTSYVSQKDETKDSSMENSHQYTISDKLEDCNVDIVSGEAAKDADDVEDAVEKDEIEYENSDSVKKWQFPYNKSTCFSNNYPEISYKDDSERVCIAPGEGKIPSSILEEKDWDLKSFPCLLPDGKNSLHSERKIKLTDQDYFVQRILNKDLRFATNPAFVFAAVAYLEKKQIQSRIGISFKRGKANQYADGTTSYTLDDACSVLDNIKNTPRYWQRTRSELYARISNLGPFTIFFTLSCGDMRWSENFVHLLKEKNVVYEADNFKDKVTIDGQDLNDYLQENEDMHDMIRQNLLNATLVFNHRVKMFVKNIIMNPDNPLTIKYYNYKVEFAMRGAAHIHGVLWVNWNHIDLSSLEIKEDDKQNIHTEENECKDKDESVEMRSPSTILKGLFDKIRNEEILTDEDKLYLAQFADLFITCTLKDIRTEGIVRDVQMHHHTKCCRKNGLNCRFYFPKFPTRRTIIAVPIYNLGLNEEEKKETLKKSERILKKVSEILQDDDLMKDLCTIGQDKINEYKLIKKQMAYIEKALKCMNDSYNETYQIPIELQEEMSKFFDGSSQNWIFDVAQLHTILAKLRERLSAINISNIQLERLDALLKKADFADVSGQELLNMYEDALGISIIIILSGS